MSGDRKCSEYFAYRQTTKVLLYTMGLWPVKNPSLFYRLLPYTCIFVSSVATFAILGFILHHIAHVPILVKGMSIGTSLMSGIIKILCLLIHRKEAANLHYILDKNFSAGLSDKTLSKLILSGITTVRQLCWTLIPTVFLTIGVYIVTPILNIIHQKRHSIHPVKYSLIYPGVYPWNIPYGIIYHIHFIIETLASITIFCVTCGVDALFAYYVFQIIGQLRIMSHRLTHPNPQENMGLVIKRCVEEYELLLLCRDSMQKIFGPIILWMMGTNAVVLCALIFQLSQLVWIIIDYSEPKVSSGYLRNRLDIETRYHVLDRHHAQPETTSPKSLQVLYCFY
ncbi:uncharacterized protein LOC135161611 isoform X2 [Diachasmimorpha longicaudata]|uniref:uncharacterized protein LOC135161611 isoform X2 n=1 Tax=Diachasmimorpha longicaudata TaxID=58733 RepID=UPI0030B8B616